MSRVVGVGLVGAGPVSQAIHIPTLTRLPDQFRVAHVMDINPLTAQSVAARVGAGHSTELETLLADPAVEVVAINSPSPLHAAQVEAALAAGKKAVFVEKPLATTREEAARIAAAVQRNPVPIMVGAMHLYDQGWIRAYAAWRDVIDRSHTIRSVISLPPNPIYEDWATEVTQRGTPPPRDFSVSAVRAGAVAGGVLGLAIHDLPLIRSALPDWHRLELLSADAVEPFGYNINARCGDRRIQLLANMHRHSFPEWSLEFIANNGAVKIDFTPSYVHAGSATARLVRAGREEIILPDSFNGYEGEWRQLYAAVTGAAPLSAGVADLIDDLTFALALSEGAFEKAGTDIWE